MQKTLALVLKKQNIGETDRIITILSPSLGKKRVIARAVRKPLSRLSGHLDTFMVSRVILTEEPDLPKVTAADLSQAFKRLRGSLVSTNRAFAISRIIERVSVEDLPQHSLFYLTVESLERIERLDPWPITWLQFLSGLTDRIGLGVSDFRCRVCRSLLDQTAHYLLEERQFVCRQCLRTEASSSIQLTAQAIKLWRLLKYKPFSQLRLIKIPEDVAQSLEEIFLREIVGWLNRPWYSYASLARD